MYDYVDAGWFGGFVESLFSSYCMEAEVVVLDPCTNIVSQGRKID